MLSLHSSAYVYVLWTSESLGSSGLSWFNVCVCLLLRERESALLYFCTLTNKYK